MKEVVRRVVRPVVILVAAFSIGFVASYAALPSGAGAQEACPHQGCYYQYDYDEPTNSQYICVFAAGSECGLLSKYQCSTSTCKTILK